MRRPSTGRRDFVSPWDVAIAASVFLAFIISALVKSAVTDLSGDEMWTRTLMRIPFTDSWPFIIRDGKHPPVFQGIAMLFAGVLPDTPLAMRSLSLLSGGLLPSLLFLLGRRFGAPIIAALSAALWAGLNAQIREHAVEARSYEFFALLILVHVGITAVALKENRRSHVLLATSVAAVAVLTHAFGFIFVFANCLALMTTVVTFRRENVRSALRSLLVIHLPAALLFAMWYGFILMKVRGTTGIAAGLEWVGQLTPADRIYSLGEVLGSSAVVGSTRMTLLLWLGILAALWIGTRRNPPARLAAFGVLASLLLPLVAQNAASGILTDLPISGSKHVMAAIAPLGLAVALLGCLPNTPTWLTRVGTIALVLISVPTLLTTRRTRSTILSDTVRHFSIVSDSAEIRALYAYGDLSVVNFYLDRACADDAQLRVQFPDVKGPADFERRSSHCVAQPGPRAVAEGTRVLFVIWRPSRPADVASRSAIERGWYIVRQRRSPESPIVVDELRRADALGFARPGAPIMHESF